jgi:GrpB-like predicted nucleotidyltransferase (UPF0157 family)
VGQDRDDYMTSVTIGARRRVDGPILLADYDPGWPGLYEREATRCGPFSATGSACWSTSRSTSVPSLPRQADHRHAPGGRERGHGPATFLDGVPAPSADPRTRWRHRLFKGPDTGINLHTFGDGSSEIARMLALP